MKKIKFSIFVLLILFCVACSANSHKQASTINASEQFGKLKVLAGNWQAKQKVDGVVEKINYRLTSGSSVLQETLFPGTEHEMLSTYYVQDDNLYMTHYCMLQNQPKLQAKEAAGNYILFDFVPTAGIDVEKNEHMHRLKIHFLDNNNIKQEWTSFKNGKPDHYKVMDLVRVG